MAKVEITKTELVWSGKYNEVNWIIETKGRVWEGTEDKDTAIQTWCERITERTGNKWKFFRINQANFQTQIPKTLEEGIRSSDYTVNGLL